MLVQCAYMRVRPKFYHSYIAYHVYYIKRLDLISVVYDLLPSSSTVHICMICHGVFSRTMDTLKFIRKIMYVLIRC